MRKVFVILAVVGLLAGEEALAHTPTDISDAQPCLSQVAVPDEVVARDIKVTKSAPDPHTGDVVVSVTLCAATQQTQLGKVGFNFAPTTTTLHTLGSNGQGFTNPYAQYPANPGQATLAIVLGSSVTVAQADVPNLNGSVLINLFWDDCSAPKAPIPCPTGASHTVMFVAGGG